MTTRNETQGRPRRERTRSKLGRIATMAVLLGLVGTMLTGCLAVPVPGWGYDDGYHGHRGHGYGYGHRRW